jgi:hypothetical protein
VPLPAFYYSLDADFRTVIELPLRQFVNEKERLIKSIERVINEKDTVMKEMDKNFELVISEKDNVIKEMGRRLELIINVKDDSKKLMQQLLDSKDQLLYFAEVREAGLIQQVVNNHAVYSPRVVVYSIVRACAVGSPRLPVGPGDVSDFVNKFIYEKDRGSGEANHNRRNYSRSARCDSGTFLSPYQRRRSA